MMDEERMHDVGRAWREYKSGRRTLDDYLAVACQGATFLLGHKRVPRGWWEAVLRGAGRGELTVADIISLERNHGGTEDV